MNTPRNGDERLSGEAHQPGAAPRLGPTAERGDASGLDRTAERIGEALRQPVNDSAEQAALAAFRSARTSSDAAPRTRRRDDWRPRTRKQRWARGGALTLVSSTLLGGIAFASIGVVDSGQRQAPEAACLPQHVTAVHAHSHAPRARRTGCSFHRVRHGTPASPSYPGKAKAVEKHCRSYEKVKGRGHALNATAWQRLVQAAGGEQHVAAYCAQLTGPANEATPAPTKTNKTEKAEKAEKSGKGQGKPSAEAKPSKGPSNRP